MRLDLHRTVRTASLAAATLLSPACATYDFLTDNCTSEFVRVTWPATITRGTSTTNVTLFGSVTPSNIDPTQFELLRDVVATGNRTSLTTIVWTVPAFDINGGYIAFTHTVPLQAGESDAVNFAFDGGGWGAAPASRAIPAAIAVRADNFNANAATGSLTAISTTPLRLKIDVTTRNAANQSMSLTGEAQFEYEKVHSNCS
jgi:hypothetical protein